MTSTYLHQTFKLYFYENTDTLIQNHSDQGPIFRGFEPFFTFFVILKKHLMVSEVYIHFEHSYS